MILVYLLTCGPKELPSALYAEPSATPQVVSAPPTDLGSAMAALVGGDPLLRRPPPGQPGQWAALPGGAPIEAWASLARQPDAGPEAWRALEDGWRGTVAVPLARGAGLAAVEVLSAVMPPLGDPAGLEASLLVTRWLSPLAGDNRPPPPDSRAPYAWLGADPQDARRAVLELAERRVLLGWLDGPDIPQATAAAALGTELYDRLTGEPAGALLLARGRDARAPERATAGEEALWRATGLALIDAAADRDTEQREAHAHLDAEAQALGIAGGDPVAALLERARDALSADAGSARSTGLALVALSAGRLVAPCGARPCKDLDRTATLVRAEAWHAGAIPAARVWQVIALKRAIDAFDVNVRLPSFGDVLPDLADALIGLGGGPLNATAINRNLPSPQLLLELSRAAGGGDELSPEAVTAALERRLATVCDHALEAGQAPEHRVIIERIARQARR